MKLSVIVPIYNEEKCVKQTLLDLKMELEKCNLEAYEIIVVDDASKDKSLEIIKLISDLKIISHEINKGYGASLKSGIKKSEYNWILILDGDGTYPVKAVSRLIAKTDEYDLVVGSREKKNCEIPFERKWAKNFLNRFASYLAGRKIPDLNSGMRIFKKAIALEYWELFPNRFSFTSTITMVCLIHGYPTTFIPIEYYKRRGQSSIRSFDFVNFIKLVIKLSLFFKPIKVFGPISLALLILAILVPILYFVGVLSKILDTTFIVLCATSLQTFFFGLLAEIIIHKK